MIRLFNFAVAHIRLATVFSIVVIGALMGIARLGLPLVSDYQDEVKHLISEETGLDVELGDIAAGLEGFTAVLVLNDLVLKDRIDGAPRLTLDKVRARVAVLASLLSGRLVLAEAQVDGAELILRRLPDGAFTLIGTQGIKETNASLGYTARVFLNIDRLNLVDSTVVWEDLVSRARPVKFTGVNLALRNDQGRHQIDLRGQASDLQRGLVRIAADFQGSLEHADGVNGSFYAQGSALVLGRLFAAYQFERFQVAEGSLDLELWAQVSNGRLVNVTGSTKVQRLKLSQLHEAGVETLPRIERLAGKFQWFRQANGWLLDVEDLGFQMHDQPWTLSRLSLRVTEFADGRMRLQAGFGLLRMRELAPIIQSLLPHESKLTQLLASTNPRGDISRLQIILDKKGQEVAWSASATGKGIAIDAWQRLPALSGLDLAFWADQSQGAIELKSNEFYLHFPRLFRQALRADQLSGRLRWQRSADGKLVAELPALQLANRDIDTLTRARLVLPGNDESPFLDLQTDFKGARVSALPRYSPVGIMRDKLIKWIDSALVSGRVDFGTALFHGPLRDFPFKQHQGRFEVLFDVDDLILDYAPAWPRLEGVSAELRFINNSLDVEVVQGFLLNSVIRNATARIDRLKKASPLIISGTVEGALSDGQRFLTETPLARHFGAFKRMQFNGTAVSRLQLQIPLRKGHSLTVDGDLRFDSADLKLAKLDLGLSDLAGKLEYSRHGVWGRGVAARIKGIPIEMDLNTLPGKSSDGRLTQITAATRWPMRALMLNLAGVDLPFVEGDAGLEMELMLPHKHPRISLTAEADLTAVAVNAPYPLGKPRGEKKTLSLTGKFSKSPSFQILAHYGKAVHVTAALHKAAAGPIALDGCEIRFGQPLSQPEQRRGLWLTGALETFNVDAWRIWSDPYRNGGVEGGMLQGLDLAFRQLVMGGREFADLRLTARKQTDTWTGTLSAAQAAGVWTFPLASSTRPVLVKLDHLTLDLSDEDTGDGRQSKPNQNLKIFDPKNLPGLDFQVEELWLNDVAMGKFRLQTAPTEIGLQISAMSLAGANMELTGNGHWVVKGEGQETRLRMAVDIKEIGVLFDDFGFSSAIDEASTTLVVNLIWPADPVGFSLEKMEGSLLMEVGKGYLSDVSPGVGRVVGLLNLGALRRRLSLDFSDLFRKGFGFDEIKGTFVFADGNAVTKDTRLEGPAARVDVSGRTGMVARDYDQLVTVTPRVSGSIPLAGALAGGPVVGAALFLAQKLVGSKVDRIGSYQYTITGAWDNPVVTRQSLTSAKRSFDAIGSEIEPESGSGEIDELDPVREFLDF